MIEKKIHRRSDKEIIKQISYDVVCVECDEEDKELLKKKMPENTYFEEIKETQNGVEISFKNALPQKVFKDVLKVTKKITAISLKSIP